MAEKKYNVTSTIQNVTAYEEKFRKQWTKRATEKNDRIVGAGYAERQIADTLSKAAPVQTTLRKRGKSRDLIERGAAVNEIALRMAGCREEVEPFKEIAAELLADIPGTVPRKGTWIRESYFVYFCSNCSNESGERTPFCPNCGAAMNIRGRRVER